MPKFIKKKNISTYITCMVLSYIMLVANLFITFRLITLATDEYGIWKFIYAYSSVENELMIYQIILSVILAFCVGISIYAFVLFWGVCRDMNIVCGRYENNYQQMKSPNWLVVGILSGLTLGVYFYYWIYKQGNRMYNVGQNCYGKKIKDKGSDYLLFSLLGLITCGICHMIANGKLIKNLNILIDAYNQELQGAQGMGYAQSTSDTMAGTYVGNQQDDDMVTIAAGDWNIPREMNTGCLEGICGFYEGAKLPIEADSEIVIGRDELCSNLVIKNPKISRKHCGIRYQAIDGTYIVTDYSTNGVFYKNGQAFQKNTPTICQPGTILVIAQSGNEFRLM